MPHVVLHQTLGADESTVNSSKSTAALRIKQFNIGGSGYARRIKDEEWELVHDAVDQLEAEGCSRRDILRTLHADHEFFATYSQLNAKMTQWQHARTKRKPHQMPAYNARIISSNLMHQGFIMDVEPSKASPVDPLSTGLSTSNDLEYSVQAFDLNEMNIANALESEATIIVPTISEQQPEPPDLSAEDTMSICSSGSSDFKYFYRYAAELKHERAATCYKSRYSSNSSHSSWGFEEVTGFPAAPLSSEPEQRPIRRIRSGVVLEANSCVTVNRSSSRQRRTVVIHHHGAPSHDVSRTLDMTSSRWR